MRIAVDFTSALGDRTGVGTYTKELVRALLEGPRAHEIRVAAHVFRHPGWHAKARRIHCCLDVTTPEPLEPDSPFRQLDNVIITPHVSGSGYYGYHLIGDQTVQALVDCFEGNAVDGAVPMHRFETIA